MQDIHTVPYENFIRLQFLIGDEAGDVNEFCSLAQIPCPELDKMLDIQHEMLVDVPDGLKDQVAGGSFPREFVLDNIEDLMRANWPWLPIILPYAKSAQAVQAALEHFVNPEVRIRIDSLILSKRCEPSRIASVMSGWSKYLMSEEVVELYSYYFCNLDIMKSYQNWMDYIAELDNKQHQYFLAAAYDVQRDSDLVVLLNDLSIREAVCVSSELAVQELMMSSFVQIKKEEKKIGAGVPARNTAIFEWYEVYCKMFDRVRATMDEANKGDALDRVRANLKTIRSNVKKISSYDITDGSPKT